MASLDPIDHTEDKEKYEAKEFVTEIKFKGCKHKGIEYNRDKSELRCPCGAAFSGSRLDELYRLLVQQD